jgi:hypothetical protein
MPPLVSPGFALLWTERGAVYEIARLQLAMHQFKT